MKNIPFTFDLLPGRWIPTEYDSHLKRTLSSMQGQYQNASAYSALLEQGDRLLYEVYELHRPQIAGELLHGVSVVHPGLVGDEYFMTKGHYHQVRETGEVYYCLQGQGKMVMETEAGEWAVEDFRAGNVLYVLPKWAHRSVNTSLTEDLIFLFIYPGNAGHDYATIEQQGFRKLVLHRAGAPLVVDNPRWHGPQGK